jgi:nitroreductase/dihydropteridine reductase
MPLSPNHATLPSPMKDTILKALNWRYAGKIFDPSKKVSEDELQTILEAGRLAPSSFGIEAWKFLVIENSETRAALRAIAYDQPKVTDASHLLVFCRRTDIRENITRELIERTSAITGADTASLAGFEGMVSGTIASRNDAEIASWVRAQTYIALGMMIETAALLAIDTCPMEGFDSAKADEILGLTSKNLASVTMLAIGHRGQDDAAGRPKVRRPFAEVVDFVR